jgi:hypothetical protein
MKRKQVTRDLRYIHFWKGELDMKELQAWLDKLAIYFEEYWLILLDEKLRRNEV